MGKTTGPPAEEAAFPRGGKQLLTPLEKKRLREEAKGEAERDFLAGEPRTKRRSAQASEEDLAFARGEAARQRLPKFAELLRFRSLAPGARVWGCVASVGARELTLSLPDGLRGVVPLEEASDVLAEQLQKAAGGGPPPPGLQALFRAGQYVRAAVHRLEEGSGSGKGAAKRRALLSLRVARQNAGVGREGLAQGMCLPACVRSVEDHGYMLTLGIKGVAAFLPSERAGEGGLLPGQLLDVVVTSAKDARLLQVSAAAEAVAGSVTKEWPGLSIGSLLPGMLVPAKVRAVLSDGLLVSFLTYFTGTIDPFHLSAEGLSGEGWKAAFSEGQRLRCRLLYVDPLSKRVCLSALQHLARMAAPSLPPVGTLVEEAVVRRVDPALGALLELPGGGAGYAHISDVADEKVDKLDRVLRPGQREAARVVGGRLMDGLAVLSLKPSAVEQFLAGGVNPGDVVKGSVVLVDEGGVLVSLGRNLSAFVPNEHLSDLGAQSKAKFKVGRKVTGRVLTVEPARKRMTLTLKKVLLESKLPALAAWEDARAGMRVHGTVHGSIDTGVFVHFYGGVKGFAHVSELGLQPGAKPADAFKPGQVVKARVVDADAAARRIRLSLASKKGGAAGAGLAPGFVGEGVVRAVEQGADGETTAFRVDLLHEGRVAGGGHLEVEHLADHPAAVAALQECLQPGASLGRVLVLERIPAADTWRLTRKRLLVAAAASLPQRAEEVREAQLLPGYVSNVVPEGVFVRFLGRLTGRAGLAQLADRFVRDPGQLFRKGQTVRAHLSNVRPEQGHLTVTLKRSVTGDLSAAFTASLFEDLEAAAAIRAAREAAAGEATSDWGAFPIGSVVEGSVHGLKPYGTLVDLAADADLVGLIPPHQARPAGDYEPGQPVAARVLDVSKADGVVELSQAPLLLAAGGAAAAPLPKVGAPLEGRVELVRDDYAVVSLPALAHAIGFVGAADFNAQGAEAGPAPQLGALARLAVAAAPSPATGGRLILQAAAAEAAPGGARRARARPQPLAAGALVTGTVAKVQGLQALLDLPGGQKGRVHVTEATDDPSPAANPLAGLRAGQQLAAAVLGKRRHNRRPVEGAFELSLRASLVAAAKAGTAPKQQPRDPLEGAAPGTLLTGYVTRASEASVWLALSARVRGRASLLDCAAEPAAAAAIAAGARAGQPLRVRVLQADPAQQRLALTLALQPLASIRPSSEAGQAQAGDLLMGRISRVAGTGVEIRLGSGVTGVASLLELHDGWAENALQGLQRGAFVRCCVLEALPAAEAARTGAAGKGRAKRRRADADAEEDEEEEEQGQALCVSLRPSLRALVQGRKAGKRAEPAQAQELTLGPTVHGYIKSVGKQGAFVAVAPGTDARIKLSQLADTFLDEPREAFPAGKLVRGRIVDTAHGRLQLSLRSERRGDPEQLKRLREGQTVRGRVRRVEEFGAFVQLSEVDAVGLVHKSELADSYVKTAADRVKPGQGVRAKVLAVDLERGRLSLGMKESYFAGESDDDGEDAAAGAASEDGSEPDLDEQLLTHAGGTDAPSGESEGEESGSDTGEGGSDPEGDLDAALLEAPPGKRPRRVPAAAAAATPSTDAASSDDEAEAPGGEVGEGDESSASEGAPAAAAPAAALLQAGVGWGGEEEAAAPEQDGGGGEAAAPARSDAAARRRAKRERAEREAGIAAAEAARLRGTAPESAADYERELLGSPGSSLLWIRYMAFLVGLGEVAKARAAAERALQAIPYREEGEKFNVWVAWLNLEATHGEPPGEALMRLFARALAFADPKRLHLALIGILERSGQAELLAQAFRAATRKFPTSAKVWLRQLAHLQARGDGEGAARLLERAVDATPARKHVKLLRQAALQEFRAGSPERGRSVFEQLLRDHPKRLDLWSVYLDQETKQGDTARTRALFERATAVVMPAKKIKFLFKRFLEYEQQHGTPATVDGVKRAAREYLQRVL